jgi:hypothetical protein
VLGYGRVELVRSGQSEAAQLTGIDKVVQQKRSDVDLGLRSSWQESYTSCIVFPSLPESPTAYFEEDGMDALAIACSVFLTSPNVLRRHMIVFP